MSHHVVLVPKLYQASTSSDVRNPPRQADSSIDEDTTKQMDNAQVKQKKGNQNSQVTCEQVLKGPIPDSAVGVLKR